jgi:DNA-binding winged helix-turn-helix (wHTH) protein/TolB-like protein
MNSPPAKLFYEFNGFRLNTERNRLYFNSSELALTHKAVEVLRVLIERRGEVVDRNELISSVWSDVAVEDGNLSVTVSLLRKVLSEHSDERFIETFPKRGYKFVGDVREVRHEAASILVETHSVGKVVVEEVQIPGPLFTAILTRFQKVLRPATLTLTLLTVFALGVGAWIYFSRRSPAPTATVRVQSVAILPFRQIGNTEENSYQGLGMADILITRLSNIREIKVRPTSAVMPFIKTDESTVAIGQQLMVDAVLEGSILQIDNRIRVTTRLIRVADQTPIWAGQFEQPANDQLRIQDQVASQVEAALVPALSAGSHSVLAKRFTQNQDAYQLYLQGRFNWNKRSLEAMLEAERLYRNAIEKDPGFALAYVGLADILVFDYPSQELHAVLDKALELDPNLAEAYATKGFMLLVHNWNWREAERHFRKSIELNPGYATAHHWYAMLLGIEGRYEEAKAEMQKALEINPLSYNFLADMGQIYFFTREYDIARQYCERALSIYPDFSPARLYLAHIHLKQGNYETAVQELSKAEFMMQKMPHETAQFEAAKLVRIEKFNAEYRRGGINAFLTMRINLELKEDQVGNANRYVSLARSYAFLGNKDQALTNLEMALNARAYLLPWVKADPLFDILHSESRFNAILEKMNLR